VMDEAALARAADLREQAERAIAVENERLAQEAARDRCDGCPEPKHPSEARVTMPNGLDLVSYVERCVHNDRGCTALVHTYLLAQPAEVTNRIIEWLTGLPQLQAASVLWMGCLAPGADRLMLVYPAGKAGQVLAAVAAIRVEDFLDGKTGRACTRCGATIAPHRVESVPQAVRCWDCEVAVELQEESSVTEASAGP
jgi:hypothetical protein